MRCLCTGVLTTFQQHYSRHAVSTVGLCSWLLPLNHPCYNKSLIALKEDAVLLYWYILEALSCPYRTRLHLVLYDYLDHTSDQYYTHNTTFHAISNTYSRFLPCYTLFMVAWTIQRQRPTTYLGGEKATQHYFAFPQPFSNFQQTPVYLALHHVA